MHVLITGGAGFIGSNLAEYHLTRGDKVHVVDDLSTGFRQNVSGFLDNPNYQFDEADILTWQNLEKAAAWADRIYHMAAVVGVYRVLAEPIQVLATNIAGTERLLRAIHAGGWSPQVILASTSEVYGHSDAGKLKEDAPLIIQSGALSRWNYAISKLADEALGLSYARKHRLQITIVRFCNTVGPRQTGRYGMVLPRFIRQAVRGEPITVFGDGNQTRSFCDVRDTVVALDLLASNPMAGGEIVNVGNDREISIGNLAELILRISGSSSRLKYIPYLQAYGENFDDITHRRPDLGKLFNFTDFKHNWALEDTIRDLLGHARAHLEEAV